MTEPQVEVQEQWMCTVARRDLYPTQTRDNLQALLRFRVFLRTNDFVRGRNPLILLTGFYQVVLDSLHATET